MYIRVNLDGRYVSPVYQVKLYIPRILYYFSWLDQSRVPIIATKIGGIKVKNLAFSVKDFSG